jgi:hypothetical protein
MKKVIKIKNKKQLRKIINESSGNMGIYNFVEFFKNGTWEIMGANNFSNDYILRIRIVSFFENSITEKFAEIEEQLI